MSKAPRLEVRVKRLVVSSVFLSALSFLAVPAHAQEQGDVGLVIALPTDIGAIWHVSDRVAVRPEINFSFGKSETELASVGEIETTGRGFSFETSVLFYLDDIDSVRTYVAPRIGFDWSSSEDNDSADDGSGNAFEASVSYGAQYSPVSRFSVFGEIGLEYGRAKSEVSVGEGPQIETRVTNWGPRTQVGVILYFNR